jgi:hypothetical protein
MVHTPTNTPTHTARSQSPCVGASCRVMLLQQQQPVWAAAPPAKAQIPRCGRAAFCALRKVDRQGQPQTGDCHHKHTNRKPRRRAAQRLSKTAHLWERVRIAQPSSDRRGQHHQTTHKQGMEGRAGPPPLIKSPGSMKAGLLPAPEQGGVRWLQPPCMHPAVWELGACREVRSNVNVGLEHWGMLGRRQQTRRMNDE